MGELCPAWAPTCLAWVPAYVFCIPSLCVGPKRGAQTTPLTLTHTRHPLTCRRYGWCTRVHIGFDVPLAHQILAAADILLMPSRFEPCGLNQLYAMRYGTIPVAHATGGLSDTIEDYNPFSTGEGVWWHGCTAFGNGVRAHGGGRKPAWTCRGMVGPGSSTPRSAPLAGPLFTANPLPMLAMRSPRG